MKMTVHVWMGEMTKKTDGKKKGKKEGEKVDR